MIEYITLGRSCLDTKDLRPGDQRVWDGLGRNGTVSVVEFSHMMRVLGTNGIDLLEYHSNIFVTMML